MITTEFRGPRERSTVVRSSIPAWQHCDVRLAQVRLLASCDQEAGVLQSLKLLGIAHQKAHEGHHPSNANYRQHGQQGHRWREALHKSLVKLNLRKASLRFAALITVVIKNDVPEKRRRFLVLAHMVEFCLQFATTEYPEAFPLDDGPV